MSSDDAKKPADVRFRPAGVGLYQLFRCLRCDLPSSSAGSRRMKWRGAAGKVCARCAKETAC